MEYLKAFVFKALHLQLPHQEKSAVGLGYQAVNMVGKTELVVDENTYKNLISAAEEGEIQTEVEEGEIQTEVEEGEIQTEVDEGDIERDRGGRDTDREGGGKDIDRDGGGQYRSGGGRYRGGGGCEINITGTDLHLLISSLEEALIVDGSMI